MIDYKHPARKPQPAVIRLGKGESVVLTGPRAGTVLR
jgi:hypothetical protein